MKRLLSLLGISLLALTLAVPAFAAEKPIKVYINGSNVAFTAGSPYLYNNTVLVPFRVVFEKLGLKVLWDAKTGTVTGTGSNLEIRLKVGSNRATVNGLVKKLTTAPVATSGTTYIPLRFIAEATGGTAVWESAGRTVQITTAVSAAADEQEITALIQSSIQYLNEENAKGFYSLFISEQGQTEAIESMNDYFKSYDVKNSIDSLKILSLQSNEATVYTKESSVRTGGRYLPDEQIEYLYSLVRKNGVWKISGSEAQNRSILLTREQGMAAAVIPQNDASVIKDNLSKYLQAMSAKNVDGVHAQMTSYGPEYDDASKKDTADFFNKYNISYTLNDANVFYYGGDEAAVYVETSVKDADSGESYKQSLIFIFSKSDSGAWTIDDNYHVAYSE
ncbi:stalk domain-containing protein [Paenibacillus sp. HW567]|uniref:stalk domain-containing protein n=1 Tax=Paenibacillus sp. HW567 TaxID=1034769 RepID=UPI00037AA90D|nr:stalk domain-containing protein [Paenibacillus sp. HW567]